MSRHSDDGVVVRLPAALPSERVGRFVDAVADIYVRREMAKREAHPTV